MAPRHPPLLGHNPTLIHAANDSPAPAARRGHAEGGGGDWGEGEVFIAADVLGHTCRRREVRPVVWVGRERLFYFYIFFLKKLQKYIFGFRFYSSIPLPSGRGAAGGLPPDRWAAGTYM